MPSLWEPFADLQVQIDDYTVARRELRVSEEFTRVTTTVVLRGGDETGQGEDVTYTAGDHENFPAGEQLAGTWTLHDYSVRLDELDPSLVADAERRKPFVARLLGGIVEQSSAPRLPTGEAARALPSDADLRHMIVTAVGSFVSRGSVVIVAHAASFALAGRDGVLRVLVTAPTETRVARLAANERVDEKQAGKVVAESDKSRAVYLERFYQVKRETPTDYDLVVNTERLTPEQAAALIVDAASQ